MTNRKLRTALSTALCCVVGSQASATILAYDGFASDITGTGNNYQQGANLEGVDKTRTGFTGSWFNEASQTADLNVSSGAGNLTYSNYVTGNAGLANPFNNSGGVQSTAALARSVSIASGLDNGYYLSMLIDYSGSEGGFIINGSSSTNLFVRSGNNVTWNPAGGSSTGDFTDTVANLGISDAQANLVVLQYTTDQTGAANNFYSIWNLWINPDLSGGSLGAADFTGLGIGLYDGSSTIVSPSLVGLSNARINNGASISVDEVYITNDTADFISVPEPSTYALIGGLGMLLVLNQRRKRS